MSEINKDKEKNNIKKTSAVKKPATNTTKNTPKTSVSKKTTTSNVKSATKKKTATSTIKKASQSTTKPVSKTSTVKKPATSTNKTIPKQNASNPTTASINKIEEKKVQENENVSKNTEIILQQTNEEEYIKPNNKLVNVRTSNIHDEIGHKESLIKEEQKLEKKENIELHQNVNNQIQNEDTKKTPKKSSNKKITYGIELIIIMIFVLEIIIFGICFTKISIWDMSKTETKQQVQKINQIANVVTVEDTSNTEIIEPEKVPDPFNPYWDYIKMNLMDVNINELKAINPRTVGWIKVEGTNINYPFVQADDNKYYLNHSFNNKKNLAGWVFMDYRNDPIEYGENTVLYGHAHKGGAVFGSLSNILEEKWQSDTNNFIVKLSTEKENSLWQIISIYTVPNTSDYIKTSFRDEADFKSFIDMIVGRSIMNFNTEVSTNDKILTLSSCYKNSDNRIALHAKLIKKEEKK